MEETIYQDVWCRAFASMWQWCAEQASTPEECESVAAIIANKAAAAAVRQWDAGDTGGGDGGSKRLAAITTKNKEGK